MSVPDSGKVRATIPAAPARPRRFPWIALTIVVIGSIYLVALGQVVFPLATVVFLVVYFLVIFYLIAPYRLKRTYWISANPVVREIDPGALGGFASRDARARVRAEALERLGFVDRGYYSIEKTYPTGDARMVIFEDRAGRTLAREIENNIPDRVLTPVLAFTTKFADGTELITSNNASPTFWPLPPLRKAFSFPDIDNEARLLALHRRAIAEQGEFSTRVDLIETDPIGYLKRVMSEESVNLGQAGYLWFDETSGLDRLTWKGAYLMTWKQIWPWGSIRRANRRRLAARRLRDWEGTSG